MAAESIPVSSKGPKKGQTQLFLSWDGTKTSATNVTLLRKFLFAKGYYIYEHAGEAFGNGSAIAQVPDEVVANIKASTVVVICVAKEYTKNFSCKKISLLARELKLESPKTAPEMLFVMIDGDYTTDSQPHKVSGWLYHLLKDSLWSPCWSYAHTAGAAEAIMGTVNLRRRVVIVTKEELRRIDRGIDVLNVPSKSPPKSKNSKSRGSTADAFPLGEESFQVAGSDLIDTRPMVGNPPSATAFIPEEEEYEEAFES